MGFFVSDFSVVLQNLFGPQLNLFGPQDTRETKNREAKK